MSARVFPEPAPARIKTGPSVAWTASCWTGLRSARRLDMSQLIHS